MSVKVTPDTFNLVNYDASEIASIVAELQTAVGLPGGIDITLEVDESTPLGRASVTSYDPVTLHLESGALEDPKRPRHLSRTGSADVIGRLLFRVHDRRDPAFGDPPDDKDIPIAHSVAWDAYCIGRLVRLGYRHYDNRQRRLYHFRNRHGFSDTADEAFDRLWTADTLTWADITRLSDEAIAAQPA